MRLSGLDPVQLNRTIKSKTAPLLRKPMKIEKTGKKYEVPVMDVYREVNSASGVNVRLSSAAREELNKEHSEDMFFVLKIFGKRRKAKIIDDYMYANTRLMQVENKLGYSDVTPDMLVIADTTKLN